MKKILYIFAATCTLALASCVKDKGNYDYTDPNAPTWDETEGLTRGWRKVAGDTVLINSFFTVPESGDTYNYEWYQADGETQAILVSTDKTFVCVVPTSGHRYMFRMQNTRTGVWYADPHFYQVEVGGNTLWNGFIFLTQNGSDIGIDAITVPITEYQAEYTLFKSDYLLERAEIEEADRLVTTGQTAVGLASVNNVSARPYNLPARALFVLTNNYCYSLNNDFSRGASLASMMAPYSAYSANDIVPSKIVSITGQNSTTHSVAFQWNNNWFATTYFGAGIPFENAINVLPANYQTPVGNEIAVSDKIAMAPQSMGIVMWSDTEHKFLFKGGTNSTALPNSLETVVTSKWLIDGGTPSADEMLVGAGTNAFNVYEPGRELIFLGSSEASQRMYAIVNDGGTYKLIFLNNNANYLINKGEAYTFPTSANTELATAKYFSLGHETSGNTMAEPWPYLYYVTDAGELRAFHLDGADNVVTPIVNSTPVVASGNAPAIPSTTIIPAGEEIVAMKALMSNEAVSNNDNRLNLYIVTKNPSLPDDSCCTLTVWRRDATGSGLHMATYTTMPWDAEAEATVPEEERETLPMQFTGIGNVIDFTYR